MDKKTPEDSSATGETAPHKPKTISEFFRDAIARSREEAQNTLQEKSEESLHPKKSQNFNVYI